MGPTMLQNGRKSGYERPPYPGMGPRHFDPVTLAAGASTVVDDAGSVIETVGGFVGLGGEHIGPCEKQMRRTLEAIKNAGGEAARQARQAVGAEGAAAIMEFPDQSAFCDLGPIPGACAGGGFDTDAFERAGGERLKTVAHNALDAAGVNEFPDQGCSEAIQAAKVLLAEADTADGGGGGGGDTAPAEGGAEDGSGGVIDQIFETFLADPLEVLEQRLEGGLAGARAGAEANDPRNRSTIAIGAVIAVGIAVVAATIVLRS